MSNERNETKRKSKSNTSVQSASESKPTKPAATKETAADIFRREIANNPRFVEAKNTGQAFIILGKTAKCR
jgi:hypothetical protein